MVNLAHFGCTRVFLLDFWSQHTFHGTLDFLNRIVDDGVETNIYAFLVCQSASCLRRTNLETDDDCIGCLCQRNIALRNLTHCLVDDIHMNLLGREFDEGVAEGFDRTVHVALDDEIEVLNTTHCDVVCNIFESLTTSGTNTLLALELFTLVGNFTSLLFCFHHVELVTCCWCTVQTEDEGWLCRKYLLDSLTALIEHCLDTSPTGSCQNDVALSECTILNKHCCHISTTLIKRGFNNRTRCLAVWICL